MESCDACPFVYADLPVSDVPTDVRGNAAALAGLLDHPDVRRRPAPEVWSALEYACHVRDVLIVQRERIEQALVEDEPDFTPMGRDDLLRDRDYNGQPPPEVQAELLTAADDFAATCQTLVGEQWSRTGIYHWPVTAARELRWVARHTAHEVRHHLADVRAGLGS